jgi:hypothetical protein
MFICFMLKKAVYSSYIERIISTVFKGLVFN